MGGALGAPVEWCSRVEPKKDEVDATDLNVFDRSTLAQVKTGNFHSHYVLQEELGSGSFGVVNKGRAISTKVG